MTTFAWEHTLLLRLPGYLSCVCVTKKENTLCKWCDGVWERFRGVRRVSVGRLGVFEDVLQCLFVSLVSGVVLGVIGGVLCFLAVQPTAQ